jgi:RNA polymerase sigma factor (sigma-70 family)
MTDSQSLLADYVQTGSETAFRELVARYVDLVYSTALRLVNGDTHRAEDVAQTVFLDLTHTARTLSPDVMLGGWLHRHTCFVAAKTMRGERRRQIRERQAVEMNALQTTPEPDFKRIAALLDDAINELGDADRTAILLRFFERHDFRSVGEALGSNEAATRMRVNRALEKLQELLKNRGLTSSAAALSVALSVNAVQAAPVGLAITISTAAALTGSTLAITATVTTTQAIAMTALQKTIVTATIAVLAGVGIYEARQASQLRDQVQTLQRQHAQLARQVDQLQRGRDPTDPSHLPRYP